MDIKMRLKNYLKEFNVDIEKKTLDNKNYREVLTTTDDTQLVVMSLKPGEEIGTEVHDGSQFIRFEGGTGKAIIGGKESSVKDGSALVISKGTEHNIINTGNTDLKLYALYSPPEHPENTVQKNKVEEEIDDNIQYAREKLAKRIKCRPQDLEYIGKEKYASGIGYHFNVIDKRHREYKSTKMELLK
jgi:mannose-6-phosphate isomerase-like protein (cupin superfamily)